MTDEKERRKKQELLVGKINRVASRSRRVCRISVSVQSGFCNATLLDLVAQHAGSLVKWCEEAMEGCKCMLGVSCATANLPSAHRHP